MQLRGEEFISSPRFQLIDFDARFEGISEFKPESNLGYQVCVLTLNAVLSSSSCSPVTFSAAAILARSAAERMMT